MKSTGIVRKVDELDRIVIPMELRNKLKIGEKDPIEIYVDGNSVILKKLEESCIFCNSKNDIIKYKNRPICSKCMNSIKNIEL